MTGGGGVLIKKGTVNPLAISSPHISVKVLASVPGLTMRSYVPVLKGFCNCMVNSVIVLNAVTQVDVIPVITGPAGKMVNSLPVGVTLEHRISFEK